MPNVPRLYKSEVLDEYTRENFKNLREYLLQETVLQGFKHFVITVSKAETNLRFKHNLGFKPLDLIQTSLTGAGSITWNYTLFDTDFIDLTSTAACEVRLFLGTYSAAGF